MEISNSWLNLKFNSLSIPKECCNLKSTNELVLLIISLANPGFKSHQLSRQFKMTSKITVNSIISTPRGNIECCPSCSEKIIYYNEYVKKVEVDVALRSHGFNL